MSFDFIDRSVLSTFVYSLTAHRDTSTLCRSIRSLLRVTAIHLTLSPRTTQISILFRRSLLLGLLIFAWTIPLHAQPSEIRELDERRIAPEAEKSEPIAPKSEEKKGLQAFFHRDDYTFIPLPAFCYARNEQYWIGAFMPILKEDQKGELSTVIEPQYEFNSLVGQTGAINIFRYPSNTAQYEVTASLSERIARNIDFRYRTWERAEAATF